MGVSLWALRCAYAHKVGVLRAALSLRCRASLRTANAPSACLTQERGKYAIATYSKINLVST
ncbi:MAG: hypothetical protein NZ455_14490 [Bacteroidia bacterium]|nr:hypothetical protein [Bacteroidia bacterium]MDW8346962.1 hypothetical protein [Bacteroidia bacterium]